MTTNTTPPPPAPVSTYTGGLFSVSNLAQHEAEFVVAYIDFARKVRADGGIDMMRVDRKVLRHIWKFMMWLRLGPNWKKVTVCEGGIVSYERIEPDGKGE